METAKPLELEEDDADLKEGGRVPTNLRTLLILEALGNSDAAMTPTQINTMIGLPKQTIHRLCARLVAEGFLAFEPDGKRLRPARRSRQMASGLLYSSRSHVARRQILETLSRDVRETVNFVVAGDSGMSYLDRVESDWTFQVQLPVGTQVPFHCTASGKTFLAGLRPEMRRKLVHSLTLSRMTPNTITDAGVLLAELAQISRDGYALDREEFVENMVAVAVPVTDPQGRFIAALAFHGPTFRLSLDDLLHRKAFLVAAAARLSELLVE